MSKRFEHLELGSPSDAPSSDNAPKPRQERDFWEMARSERQAGCYENALKHYSRALELDKTLLEGWLGQLQMLMFLDETPEAETWSRKAQELFHNQGDLIAAQAHAMVRQNRLVDAQILCDQSLALSGISAYRWQVRGELFLARHDAVAPHCFDKVRQLDGSWLMRVEIGLSYRFFGHHIQALDAFRQAVELASLMPYPWLLKAESELQLGFVDQARGSCLKVLELEPNHLSALRLMREIEDRLGTLSDKLRGVWNRLRGGKKS